jgi:hypothetical protein
MTLLLYEEKELVESTFLLLLFKRLSRHESSRIRKHLKSPW